MLSVVIPISNLFEYTDECVETLQEHALQELDIIIIDNNSTEEYKHKGVRVVRNEKNMGYWPSMLQGIEVACSDIVMTMHNDVYIWQDGFDIRVKAAFQLDQKLAMAGLFGSRGVAVNGGRAYPESNMIGKKYGTAGSIHGHTLLTDHPSVVFDSYMMTFRKSYLQAIPHTDLPPHHWTDRLVTLRFLRAGYRLLTLGIPHDHGGGFTSTKPTMSNFTEQWCNEQGLELDTNWDYTLYRYGERMYQEEFLNFTQGNSQLWVDQNFRLEVRG